LDFIASQQIPEQDLKFQIKVWLTDVLGLAKEYTKNEEIIAASNNFLNDFGKCTISMEEFGIVEPKVIILFHIT